MLCNGGISWYAFPKVDDTVLGRAFMGITGVVISLAYKTPE
jgi:hypothetical protein